MMVNTHKGFIRLVYRKLIDANAAGQWEKLVFEDSYAELLLQAQNFNQHGKFTTYAQLIRNGTDPGQLNFLVSAAVIGYLQQLNDTIPDITNNLGKLFLKFKQFRFEIINSDFTNRARHQVAVSFYSDPLTWHDTIGSQLLLSVPGELENGVQLTQLFTIPDFVSIYSLQDTL